MFRVNNKDIRMTTTLSFSLAEFETVNVCWNHSLKKRKDTLETRAKPTLFSL